MDIQQAGFMYLMMALICYLRGTGKVPYVGELPGDLYIETARFTIYLPLLSSFILSMIFSWLKTALGR